MSLGYRQRLLATTLLVGSFMGASPAFAQNPPADVTATQPAAPSSGSTLGADPATAVPTQQPPANQPVIDPNEIVVTGTRISGLTNANNPSPISVATAEQIQLTKATSIEDVLQRMTGPDSNGLSNTSNNGGNGFSTVSLRNLGAQRTLVLIDGTRLIPNGSNVDINMIPIAMVERIDVLRDGASSVYGADAIGGVVNIITKQHADGFHIEGGGGLSQHGGGNTYNISSTFAANTDRSNIIIGLSWDHRDKIDGYQRDWANDPHIGDAFEGGSTYRTQLNTLQAESDVTLTNPTVIDGVLRPSGYVASGLLAINGQFYTRFNPAVASLLPNTAYLPNVGAVKLNANGSKETPWNTLSGSLDRKEISLGGHYDLTDGLSAFADGFFSHRTSLQLLRPEPLLGDTIANSVYPGFFIPGNAPGNTTGTGYYAYLIPEQFGPRTYTQTSDTFRIRGGLRGEVQGFKYEIAGVEQQNDFKANIANSGNFLHLGELTGQLPCIDVPGGCTTNGLGQSVPVTMPNFFNGPDNIFTPAQLDYARFTSHQLQHSSERYVYANASGSLFKLPGGDVKISVGGEYREEKLSNSYDELVTEGFAANQAGPTKGGYNVKSVYGELYVPILSDVPFFKELDVTPSGRIDRYSTFGTAKTYKIGANWAPSEDIRFRGSYGIGFRAPQVSELFGGQGLSNLGASGDPCETNLALKPGNSNIGQGVLTAGSTCSQAVAGGAAVTTFTSPLDQIQGSQIQALIGGNPALQPEKSKGYTFGVVLTPRFAPGLSLEADFYRTKVSNQILSGGIATVVGVDYLLLDCYGPAQNSASCALITRGPSGTILTINSLNDNIGSNTVKGYDLEVTFDTRRAHWDLPAIGGSIRLDGQLSRLIKNNIVNADGSVTKYAGTFNVNSELTFPKWKGLVNFDYSNRNFGLHWDSQYSSKLVNFDGSDPEYGNKVKARWTHSASIYYNLQNVGVLKATKFIVGVDNVFDKDPPFIAIDSICKCNSIAGPYDFTGRMFYFRVSADFGGDRSRGPAPLPPVVAPPPPPPAPPPATQTCADGAVILATDTCPVAPPPPPPPPPAAGERG